MSGAELKLEALDASNNRSVVAQWKTEASGAKNFPLTAGTYCLTETNAPDGYTAANEMTFTVTDNLPFTVELVNHKIDEGNDDVTIQDSVTVTFKSAENWAHKLTSDDEIQFQHEILFWKGKYYYAIPETVKRASSPFLRQHKTKRPIPGHGMDLFFYGPRGIRTPTLAVMKIRRNRQVHRRKKPAKENRVSVRRYGPIPILFTCDWLSCAVRKLPPARSR